MIDVKIGKDVVISGKLYRAKKAEYFGSKKCLCCALHKVIDCKTVKCYQPDRVFEQLENLSYCDYYDDDPIDKLTWQEALVLLIIFAPVGEILWVTMKTKNLLNTIKNRKWKAKQ